MMGRNFGIMSRLEALGGSDSQPATRDEYASRDSFDPLGFAFERSKFAQALIDIAAVLGVALFVFVTGLGWFLALFFLLTG